MEIKWIYTLLYKLSKIEEQNITINKINHYLQQICIDYNDNPTRMINSILKWHKKRIVIDRLFVKENGRNRIILDPDEIKTKVNHYFQNIAVPNSPSSPINERWSDQYKPLSNVDAS